MRNICLLGTVFFFLVNLSYAEIRLCDGKWTNQPCAGTSTHTIEETTSSEVKSERTSRETRLNSQPLAPRLQLDRQLRRLNDEYRRKNGITVTRAELDSFRRDCTDLIKPHSSCLAEYQLISERLTKANQQKEHNELLAEQNRINENGLQLINDTVRALDENTRAIDDVNYELRRR